ATLSERLKNAISVYDFVGRYVDLDERGTGLCPFHDDQRRSFGVNREENFWHCWAGCGGGSLIDFWMKWREREGLDASFSATLKALADILLLDLDSHNWHPSSLTRPVSRCNIPRRFWAIDSLSPTCFDSSESTPTTLTRQHTPCIASTLTSNTIP